MYGKYFIAGWADATGANGTAIVIVWLQGGDNTYYINSAINPTPVVYDGVQQALPYQEPNGPDRTYKTSIDNYVNSNGDNIEGSAFYTGGSDNYFAGYVGIGTKDPDELLTVNGKIHSKEVKVDLNVPGPDYVFEPDYKLSNLTELKAYIDKNHHLPEIPSAKQMEKEGLNLGEMNVKLLKKVEELTLYLIEKDNKDKEKDARLQSQQEQIEFLKQEQEKSKQQDERIAVLEKALAKLTDNK
ncbi:MAG: hypothetical protein JWQ34_312 [Mucilaginibacter sp.]|uniref:tail fiber protein n=1 Tax=Mucilaginibacter sp. TaxID=1882438 RepID=UPI0026088357|nr:tail fiber protein [Mucilaginibacter sp.]MDB5002087.1 hypothetical protein [Mucilaginibacter sp.]